MSFEKLLDEKKIEQVEKEEFNSALAESDLETARRNFENEDYEWASSIAYNSVLRVSRKMMAFLGYRAIGKEHHKHVFEFLKETGFDLELVNYFDNIRKQRNSFIYRDFEVATEENAKEVIGKAEDFVHKIRTFVHKIRTEEAGK